MPIIRLIMTTFPADQAEAAERDWRDDCAPMMIRQPGCLSEKLLRSTNTAGDYISYSEWADNASIEAYLRSDDHLEIKRRTSGIAGATVTVKTYEVTT